MPVKAKPSPSRADILADIDAALAQVDGLALPVYDPAHEITARDLLRKHPERNIVWAERKLVRLQRDSGWTLRQVRLPSGHRARAWRPGTLTTE